MGVSVFLQNAMFLISVLIVKKESRLHEHMVRALSWKEVYWVLKAITRIRRSKAAGTRAIADKGKSISAEPVFIYDNSSSRAKITEMIVTGCQIKHHNVPYPGETLFFCPFESFDINSELSDVTGIRIVPLSFSLKLPG